jgi:tight adherence protein B
MFPVLSESPTLLALLVLVAVLLLFEGCYLSWRSYRGDTARRLGRRLGSGPETGRANTLLRQRPPSQLPMIEALFSRWQANDHIAVWLAQSGSAWNVTRLVATVLCAAVLAFVLVLLPLHQPLWIALLLGLAAGLLPPLWIARLRTRRLKAIERQLPDALDLMVRAMRAGHAFSSALQMSGTEMNEPVAAELRLTHEEVNFGVPLESALLNLERRVPLMDLRYFVVAVLVQREAGGNLTEVLTNLSRLVRERLKLLARVRVLTAEGRLSAWILALLPFMLFALIASVNRTFMEPLWTDPLGIALVRIMLAMMLAGVIWLRHITHVRV